MKKYSVFSSLLLCIACLATSAVACSSDGPEEPKKPDTPVTPDKPDVPEEDGKFGLKPNEVNAYFEGRIKETSPKYEVSGKLTTENITAASEYVWGLWKQAVSTAETEKLPAPATISGYWDEKAPVHFSWKVGSESMNSTYALKGTKPATGYPMFIFLHGSGDDAYMEWTNILYLIDGTVTGNNPIPSSFIVPKSPKGGTNCRWFPPTRQKYWERAIRQALVGGQTDPNKIYFTGISEGAYGSQRLASFYADYLAGVSPISGGDQLFNAPAENLANVFYRSVNGSEDTMYGRYLLTNKAKEELDRLEKAHPGHYKHSFKMLSGVGHFEWKYMNDYNPVPDLVKQTRNPLPKYFYWENFGMGGQLGEGYRYREGFYNLLVLEPSSERNDNLVRDCYEMTINGNTIDLNVNTVKVTPTESVKDTYWEMQIGVEKSFTQATKGKVRIYLNGKLVDLSKPVVVKVNGVEKFNGTVTPDTRWLVESCGIFFDPERLFPAAVDVTI